MQASIYYSIRNAEHERVVTQHVYAGWVYRTCKFGVVRSCLVVDAQPRFLPEVNRNPSSRQYNAVVVVSV